MTLATMSNRVAAAAFERDAPHTPTESTSGADKLKDLIPLEGLHPVEALYALAKAAVIHTVWNSDDPEFDELRWRNNDEIMAAFEREHGFNLESTIKAWEAAREEPHLGGYVYMIGDVILDVTIAQSQKRIYAEPYDAEHKGLNARKIIAGAALVKRVNGTCLPGGEIFPDLGEVIADFTPRGDETSDEEATREHSRISAELVGLLEPHLLEAAEILAYSDRYDQATIEAKARDMLAQINPDAITPEIVREALTNTGAERGLASDLTDPELVAVVRTIARGDDRTLASRFMTQLRRTFGLEGTRWFRPQLVRDDDMARLYIQGGMCSLAKRVLSLIPSSSV